jgi:hypothetical protein
VQNLANLLKNVWFWCQGSKICNPLDRKKGSNIFPDILKVRPSSLELINRTASAK